MCQRWPMRLILLLIVGLLAACQTVPSGRGGDPARGQFTLREATRGLRDDGALVADIRTSLGTLSCTLFDERAPITVANFVGLARGVRPWQNAAGKWVRKPAYDGTTFHRIVRGFMLQGGDPQGTGEGDPGYVIADEIWTGAIHDRRGQLAMANRGPNTNGMQFFVTDGPARHLDGGFTIFGQCEPDEVIERIAAVDVRGSTPTTSVRIDRIEVRRLP